MQIKTIRALQHKKYRQKYSQFIVEGVKITFELLKSKHIQVESLFILSEYLNKIPMEYQQGDIDIQEVTEIELKKISCLSTPQGILTVCRISPQLDIIELKNKKSLLLDAIRNPGNLGTIIRIADWFGIHQIVCSPDCVDVYNPKTIQATMGSIARVPVNTADLIALLKQEKEVDVFAATLDGKDITEMDKIAECAIIIGNESQGISKDLISLAKEGITIPRIGEAESLNAAVATGIICSRLLL